MENILILSNSIGGLFSFRKEVIAAITKAGYMVSISCPEGNAETKAYFENLGCTLINASIDRRGTNPLSDFKLLRQYRKLILSIKPKVVLTYTIKPNIYGGMACRKKAVK